MVFDKQLICTRVVVQTLTSGKWMEVVIVATVSTDSAVFVATRPVYPSICVDIVLAYRKKNLICGKYHRLLGN